jgi:hypothetical protein
LGNPIEKRRLQALCFVLSKLAIAIATANPAGSLKSIGKQDWRLMRFNAPF